MKQLIFSIFLLSCFGTSFSQDRSVTLKDEKIATAPDGYRINGFIDERADKSAIGDIDYGNGKKGRLVLQNGTDGLLAFTDKNLTQDKSARPMFLHITRFHVSVKKQDDQWLINTDATLVFYASGYKLIELTDKGRAETSDDPEIYVEGHIRKIIETDIKAFNEWWPANQNQIATSPDVQVKVTIAKSSDNPDVIVYSQQRLLQIADFTGPSQAQGYEMAATLSGIDFKTSGTVENGQTVVNVVITPYFDIKQSWFKEEGKVPSVLAHEQTHFDITAANACELANKIQSTKFNKEDYNQVLNKLYQEETKASYDEENAYDAETNHGIIKDKQEAWEKKLKEKIKTVGCY